MNLLSEPDVTLMLDADAVIQSVTVSNTLAGEFVKTWLGRPWIETVADSGVEKVRLSLDDARAGGLSAYRRILQRFPSGMEMPIEYTTVKLGDAGLIAIGRNLQGSSELQSRLIAAQQAMERDYWKLREVETRYRLLFDASNDAVLVLSSDDLRVVEANPAAIRALGHDPRVGLPGGTAAARARLPQRDAERGSSRPAERPAGCSTSAPIRRHGSSAPPG